jgi:hypothetical protein
MYLVNGGGFSCKPVPQLQASEYFFGPVRQCNGTVIIAGLAANRRLYRLDRGNTQPPAGQGTGQAGAHHAPTDNDDVILFHD